MTILRSVAVNMGMHVSFQIRVSLDIFISLGFPRDSVVKNLPANAGTTADAGSIPGSGRSHGEGKGNPLHYSCQDNPMDRGAWRPTIHGVAEQDTAEQLSTLFNGIATCASEGKVFISSSLMRKQISATLHSSQMPLPVNTILSGKSQHTPTLEDQRIINSQVTGKQKASVKLYSNE